MHNHLFQSPTKVGLFLFYAAKFKNFVLFPLLILLFKSFQPILSLIPSIHILDVKVAVLSFLQVLPLLLFF